MRRVWWGTRIINIDRIVSTVSFLTNQVTTVSVLDHPISLLTLTPQLESNSGNNSDNKYQSCSRYKEVLATLFEGRLCH